MQLVDVITQQGLVQLNVMILIKMNGLKYVV